ncbi:DUF2322 family protein [Psittacicella hinzii]|nr:DUF2322 family protein [Psittacicella hinzii]
MTNPLDCLPSAAAVKHINIYDQYNNLVRHIDNVAGKHETVKLFNYLSTICDSCLDCRAGLKGLDLYADYVADAIANPGKHGNVDFLLQLVRDKDTQYRVEVVDA